MKEFLKSEWKFILVSFLIIMALGICYYEYKSHKSLPIQTITSVTPKEVSAAMSQMGIKTTPAETKYITERITETKQSPPQIIYVTPDQKSADKQANTLAKQEKADFILKEPTSEISNNFYSVHTEKNHKIKAGVSVVDSQAYVNLGYQQNQNEFIVHYAPATGKYGGTYMRTIKEW